MLPKLNFPQYSFRIKKSKDKLFIFDIVRRKFVNLSPEEWVRQHIIAYLSNEKKFPLSLLTIEKEINLNGRSLRPDIVAFNQSGLPILLVECKAPDIKLTSSTLDQASTYNLKLGIKNIYLSNGLQHYFLSQQKLGQVSYFSEIPEYSFLLE